MCATVGFLFLGPRCANYPDVSTLATNDLLGSEVMTQQLNPNQTITDHRNHFLNQKPLTEAPITVH
jgi:hypothetical protein